MWARKPFVLFLLGRLRRFCVHWVLRSTSRSEKGEGEGPGR